MTRRLAFAVFLLAILFVGFGPSAKTSLASWGSNVVRAATGEEQAGSATVGTPITTRLQFLSQPPQFDQQIMKKLQDARARVNRPGPPLLGGGQTQILADNQTNPLKMTPSQWSNKPQVTGDSQRNGTFRGMFNPVPLSLGSSQVWVDQPVTNTVFRSTVDEPSLANKGSTVFYTGNWYAARSTNFGSSWSYVDPYGDMSDFCCDQDLIFDTHFGVFLWNRLGLDFPSAGDARIYLGASSDASSWCFYSFLPSDLVAGWTDRWFDYPQLSLSTNYLYVTANLFYKAGGWANTVILRFPLSNLAGCSGFTYYFYWTTSVFNFTATNGATSTMYWGSHWSTAVLRVYTWPESVTSTGVSLVDRTIPTWYYTGATHSCPGPDTNNWCGRDDFRIHGAYVANGEIAFFWDIEQGADISHPYPWINVAKFRQSDRTYQSSTSIFNANFAFAYPDVYPNSRFGLSSDIGLAMFYGGGSFYPSFTDEIWIAGANPFFFDILTSGTNGPSNQIWGDYVKVRPYVAKFCPGSSSAPPYPDSAYCAGYPWITGGYTLQGGSGDSNAQPRFYLFGRDFESPYIASMDANVIQAAFQTVTIILPDYTAPRHTSAAKCGGVATAQLTDYAAAGYILAMLSNTQYEALDTTSSIISQAAGTCGLYTGSSGTILMIAGPAVNEPLTYYERIGKPIYGGAYSAGYQYVDYFVDRTWGFRHQVTPVVGTDYFTIQAYQDENGKNVYAIYGAGWTGTLAGTLYFFQYLYPNIGLYTYSVTIGRWQDAASGLSHNGFPDPGDSFIELW